MLMGFGISWGMVVQILLLSRAHFNNSRQNLDLHEGPSVWSKNDDINNKRPWPQFGPECPLAVQKNTGIFDKSSSNSIAKDNFRDVILLVSCNDAYYDMLQNWEYLAKDLNITWAVLALDEALYSRLGPERAISPGNFSVTGSQRFRAGSFNKLSCNKMRMALSVAENCGVDVVFSDVDNIFYHNPFEHDLGQLIESRRYDYIYQPNDEPTNGKPHEDQCLHGQPRNESNTGFYFFNRNSKVMKTIVNSTLHRCDKPENELDDQALFWQELWNHKQTSYRNNTFHHCSLSEYIEPFAFDLEDMHPTAVFNFCCLDPFYYPIGNASHNNNPITYHANFVIGKEKKLAKLKNSRRDYYGWSESRVVNSP